MTDDIKTPAESIKSAKLIASKKLGKLGKSLLKLKQDLEKRGINAR